jgi:large subunit ribosomal protein L18
MQNRKRRRVALTRQRRAWRVRKKLHGTAERPRLTVFRSLKDIYAQLIDDDQGRTIVAVSSLSREMKKGSAAKKTKTEISKEVGQLLAQKAMEKGLSKAVFDRGPYLYHGRVKALANGAREGGLEF